MGGRAKVTAAPAGVSVPTILRHCGSKENLHLRLAEFAGDREATARAVPPGDVRAVARVLARRYETTGPAIRRFHAIAERGESGPDTWIGWRTSLGLSAAQAEQALADALEAILASWPHAAHARTDGRTR